MSSADWTDAHELGASASVAAAPSVPKQAGAPEAAATAAEPRLRDGVGYAAKVFAAVWVGWALLGLLGVGIVTSGKPVSVPGLGANAAISGWHNLFIAGDRGDALWYQRIAAGGYGTTDFSAAFFPLYPMAIRIVTLVPGIGTLGAALLVAQGCFFGSLVVFYALSLREFGRETARRACRYLAVFPTAFFFLAPYTEAPFLLFTLLTFWFARRDRWLWAAVVAALAGATRSAGIVLVPALVVEAVIAGRGSLRLLLPRLSAAAAPLVGLFAYMAYWGIAHADWTAPFTAQKRWQRVLSLPTTTVVHAARDAWRYQSYWLIDVLVVAVVIVAVIWGARLMPRSYLAFAAASVLLPLCEPDPDRPLLSMPRFVAVIFPTFWVISWLVARRRLSDSAVMASFVGGYVLLGLLFMNWYYIF